MTTKESILINGAGPVGALLTLMLARRGYQLNVFESRPDSRKADTYQGKSINIALSDRGWKALHTLGIDKEIREQAIPLYCRIMHDLKGNLTRQPYGCEGQAIWSISRAGINEQLLSLAEQYNNVSLHFDHRLTQLDFASNTALYQNSENQQVKHQSSLVFGADGAFSKVRRLMQDLHGQRISYSLEYMPQSYLELSIPAGKGGSYLLEKNALHIWPRKNFMLIALPNPEGSFTCTLFMNHEGDLSFSSLNSRTLVASFFEHYFPDAMPLLEHAIEDFMSKPPSPLCLVHVSPWLINHSVALIGDAAHAMVPFYGQGMNCGFEDCRILMELIDEHHGDWCQVMPAYQQARKVNCDAITELARHHFNEMSELSGDPRFLLRKKIEAEFHQRHPDLWTPLYSMVTFSPDIPYHEALVTGDIQRKIMDEIMATPDIENCWQSEDIYLRLYHLASAQLSSGSLI